MQKPPVIRKFLYTPKFYLAAKPNLNCVDVSGCYLNLPASATGWYHDALLWHQAYLHRENVKKSSRHPVSSNERKGRKRLSSAVAEKCGHQRSLVVLCLGTRWYGKTGKKWKGRLLKSGWLVCHRMTNPPCLSRTEGSPCSNWDSPGQMWTSCPPYLLVKVGRI